MHSWLHQGFRVVHCVQDVWRVAAEERPSMSGRRTSSRDLRHVTEGQHSGHEHRSERMKSNL